MRLPRIEGVLVNGPRHAVAHLINGNSMVQSLLHIGEVTTTGGIGRVNGREGAVAKERLITLVPIREDEVLDDVTTGQRVL